jgi:glutamine amidotransferase PdxT
MAAVSAGRPKASQPIGCSTRYPRARRNRAITSPIVGPRTLAQLGVIILVDGDDLLRKRTQEPAFHPELAEDPRVLNLFLLMQVAGAARETP